MLLFLLCVLDILGGGGGGFLVDFTSLPCLDTKYSFRQTNASFCDNCAVKKYDTPQEALLNVIPMTLLKTYFRS